MPCPRLSNPLVPAVPVLVGLVAAVLVAAAPVARAQPRGNAEDAVPLPTSEPGPSHWQRGRPATGSATSIAGAAGEALTSSSTPLPGNLRRLHVKFHEGLAPTWRAGQLVGGASTAEAAAILASEPGVRVEPLFERPVEELAAERADAELASGEPQPDLSSWYLVTTTSAASGARLVAGLGDLAAVEMVQPEPVLATSAPEEEDRQGYLDAAPGGVSAEWSWRRAAGTGNRVTVVVVDSGFDTSHPDLDAASSPGVAIPHEEPWDPRHGLQVLGILAADDDGAGLRGIASGAGLRTVNSGRTSGQVANAISLATAAVGPGDVISVSQGICAQSGCAGGVVLPLVYSASARDALRLAAARGVIPVVSAGNGGADLTAYADRLGRDAPDTIVIGAGNPPPVPDCAAEDGPARSRVATSNYGTRVDLQGWGACVRTAEQGGGYRWWGFTSAATPIVAGAAALVSSLAERRAGVNLTGGQVRTILAESGAPQVTAGGRGGHIGPQPDVRAAVKLLDRLPANDMWAGATKVATLPYRTTLDSRWAGIQVDEPSVTCGTISNTVWFEISPLRAGTLTVDTRGSDHDTMLGLWRRSGGELQRVACADDIGADNTRSELHAQVDANARYYVQAGGADASGTLRITMRGTAVVGVGCDVDGDGHGDIVSGSPREDIKAIADAGRAVVHFGRAATKPRRARSITQAWPGLVGRSEKRDRLGGAAACGDFNGDGYSDVALGSPGEGVGAEARAGAVRIVPGASDGLSRTTALTLTQDSAGLATGAGRGERFGAALAVGDFDGDGYDDLAIGSPGETVRSRARAGRVHVVFGSPDGLGDRAQMLDGDTRGLPNSAERDDELGASLAAGDFDFDGRADLAIGVPGEGLGGRAAAGLVLTVPGSATGLDPRAARALHHGTPGIVGKNKAGDRFGDELAAGDVTGDDRDDLVVGVPNRTVDGSRAAGRVHLVPGSRRGLTPAQAQHADRSSAALGGRAEIAARFGASVDVGDIDGDGHADVLIGAPRTDVSNVNGAGEAVVIFGTASGFDLTRVERISQATPGVPGAPERSDRFGTAVALVDLAGDGRRDLVIGAPREEPAKLTNSGMITLVPGGPGGIDPAGARRLTQASPRAGKNESGDQFGAVLAKD